MAENVFRNIVAPTTEQMIKYELRCPKCKEPLGAPIYHCDKGHSFCNICYKRGNECIICGSPFSGGRTHHLERIADLFTYPCKYSFQGCRKICRIKKLRAHEEGCKTFEMFCPFKYEQNCPHIGDRLQTVFHCQLNHRSQTIMGDDDGENLINIKLSNLFLDNVHEVQNHLFMTIGRTLRHKSLFMLYTDDIIFLLVCHLDLHQVLFEAYRVSSPSEEDQIYELKLIFSYKDSSTKPLILNLECGTTNGCEDVLVFNKNVVPADIEAVKKSSHFAVQMIEKNY